MKWERRKYKKKMALPTAPEALVMILAYSEIMSRESMHQLGQGGISK